VSGTLDSAAKYSVATDASNRKVTLTITGSYAPNETDYLTASVKNLRNPTASGSYVADVTTKNSLGQTSESFKTFSIFIKEAPAGATAKVAHGPFGRR
jgi:hypothetical protein